MKIFELITHFVFMMALGYYLITALQWYSYKIKRVLFHYNKPAWHFLFFILPIFIYYFAGKWAWIYIYFAYIPWLIAWHKRLDKPLVFTKRVKRFLAFLAFFTIFQDLLCFFTQKCVNYGLFLPIIAAIFFGTFYEKLLFHGFYKRAQKKLKKNPNLIIIAITASFGKTSIKHFLYEILSKKYKCYHSPNSINTLTGLVQDVNTSLSEDVEVYIAEAGAREEGDIEEIAKFLEPQVVIVGEIGLQHIEYFKTLERVRNTKMELTLSPSLKKAFVHKSANIAPSEVVVEYGDELVEIDASLEGTIFKTLIEGKEDSFETPILGEFSARNLLAAILVAKYLKVDDLKIKDAIKNLKHTPHRLDPMRVGGKFILDDSYNGNRSGMELSYKLASSFLGRKVLITPGIVESNDSENALLGKAINEVFDVVIISSPLNAQVLLKELKKPKVHILKDKKKLEELLAAVTKEGDLILFSNDAPSYI